MQTFVDNDQNLIAVIMSVLTFDDVTVTQLTDSRQDLLDVDKRCKNS